MYEIKTIEKSEGRQRLEIWHNGKMLAGYCDGGEPEDNYFFRDWGWVLEELERAYNLGLEDGKAGK